MRLKQFRRLNPKMAGTVRPTSPNRRANAEVRSPLSALVPPHFLEDAAAIDEWNRIVHHVQPQLLCVPAYRMLLAGYCSSIAKAIRAEMIISKEGRYYTTHGKKGSQMKRRHPAAQDAEEAWISARRFAKQLGLLETQTQINSVSIGRRFIFK